MSATESSSARTPWTYLWHYRAQTILGVVFLLATNVFFLAEPILLGRVVDALQGDDPGGEIPTLVALMVAFAIATAITRIGSRVFLFNAARMAEHDLRIDLFTRMLRFDPAYFRSHATGDVMSRLTNDVQSVRVLWGPGVLNVVNTAVAFATVITMMVIIDPMLTLWAMLPYPSMVLFGRLFAGRLYRHSREVQAQLGDVSSRIQEDLSGMAIVKAYSLEDQRGARFAEMSEDLLRRNMILTNLRGQMVPTLSGVASISTVILLYVGGVAVIDGRISLGELVEFNSYLARLVWPTLSLGWMLSLFQRGFASWRRLEEMFEVEPEIKDGPGPDLARVRGDLEIRGLTVVVDGKEILSDIDLHMPAGSITAIVGRTGSGKSMLVAALPRLIAVPDGTVFLDGRDINELPLATLRQAIGYAPQEAFLFSTTIAQNIAFGYERSQDAGEGREVGAGARDRVGEARASEGARPVRDPALVVPARGAAATDERLLDASRAAGLSRDLEALPAGYDTVVGERGVTLSGGQRQRVALARALATMPQILILDDSLSSVDAETERDILGHLTELMRDRTAILISHRVAAVKRADRIVVLDEGRVVEEGSHEELLALEGVYAEVYRTQLDEAGMSDADGGEGHE